MPLPSGPQILLGFAFTNIFLYSNLYRFLQVHLGLNFGVLQSWGSAFLFTLIVLCPFVFLPCFVLGLNPAACWSPGRPRFLPSCLSLSCPQHTCSVLPLPPYLKNSSKPCWNAISSTKPVPEPPVKMTRLVPRPLRVLLSVGLARCPRSVPCLLYLQIWFPDSRLCAVHLCPSCRTEERAPCFFLLWRRLQWPFSSKLWWEYS